jgi:hypothetical protein
LHGKQESARARERGPQRDREQQSQSEIASSRIQSTEHAMHHHRIAVNHHALSCERRSVSMFHVKQ